MKTTTKLLFTCLLIFCATSSQGQEVMANSLDVIPTNWAGKKFEMSKTYPTVLPTEPEPWKSINFKTQPLQYINAVKQYVLEGNVAKDWVFKNNTVRKWYHAPAMIWGDNGREFINGMTRERSSRPKELHPNQVSSCQNWAVGFYNSKGGFTFGKVFANPNAPNSAQAIFPEGTVSAKLLFTNASVAEVPYLQNAFEWQANIHTAQNGTDSRSPKPVRLLQMDVGVKDNRAATDWVMITFAYNNNAVGTTPWDKLVPIGMQWGNDPNSIATGAPLTETWINPTFKTLFTVGTWTMHTGYKGRFNGPVDNPNSSCLSCHGTSQDPKVSTGMIPSNDPASLKKYFRNINPPAVFEDLPSVNERTLDYSLQLTVGIPLARGHAPHPLTKDRGLETIDSATVQGIKKVFLTTRDFDEDEVFEAPMKAENAIPTTKTLDSDGSPFNFKWIGLGILAAIIGLLVFFRNKK
jgi:hypothetical protein